MNDAAIQVEGLSKRYRLGATPGLGRRVASWARGRRMRREAFWALRDVSFEVPRGEVLGVVGGNGAGKSTLLKILSRITDPSGGRAIVRGRVGSLLEVGTGFHPELTGRENIFLSGAVLGMSRAEVKRRFDEIVDFAGVDAFLGTPVKRYSSGMYVRLAFAVAAHLQPEVLIVDEVLAVGDASFQSKCLGRMSEVADSGRTVLFVSHNMGAVESLCTRAILLERGRLQEWGMVGDVIECYRQRNMAASLCPLSERRDRTGTGEARMVAAEVRPAASPGGGSGEAWGYRRMRPGESMELRLRVETCDGRPLKRVNCAMVIQDSRGVPLGTLDAKFVGSSFEELPPVSEIVCRSDDLRLAPGRYLGSVYLTTHGRPVDVVRNALAFEIEQADYFGTGRLPAPAKHGPLLLEQRWHFREIPMNRAGYAIHESSGQENAA